MQPNNKQIYNYHTKMYHSEQNILNKIWMKFIIITKTSFYAYKT